MPTIITHYPDFPTVNYAQLWLKQPFVILANSNWWPVSPLPSEAKRDEWEIGYQNKIDIPGPCWVVVGGSALATVGTMGKFLRLVEAANEDMLDSPPGDQFLPVRHGVNALDFDDMPEPSPQPEPSPEPSPDPEPDLPPVEPPPPVELPEGWVPHSITFYGPHFSNKPLPYGTRWGDNLVYVVPRDWIVAATTNTMLLLDKVKDVPIDH